MHINWSGKYLLKISLPLDEDPMVYHEEIVGAEVVRTLEYLRAE